MSVERNLTPDNYELIGKPIELFHAEIGYAIAIELHNYVAQKYFPSVMRVQSDRKEIVPQLEETADTVAHAIKFGYDRFTNPDADSAAFTGVRLHHDSEDTWKLRVLLTRYKHDLVPNKTIARYFLDIVGGQIFQAKKQVRVVRSGDELDVIDLMSDAEELPSTERIAFERPLTEQSCSILQERLAKVARRCIALGMTA